MIERIRSSVVCLAGNKLLVIELQDPTTQARYFSVPGGAIEAGESSLDAAERETLEETGYSVAVDPSSLTTTQYPFDWDGEVYDCTTHWYSATLKSESSVAVDDADYLLGHQWICVAEIDETFAYNQTIRQTIKSLVQYASR